MMLFQSAHAPTGGAAHVRPRSGSCMHDPAGARMRAPGPRRMRRGLPKEDE